MSEGATTPSLTSPRAAPSYGVLRRALAWLLRPLLSRPVDMLDRVLGVTDGKVRGVFRRIEAGAGSPPRHRFTAPEIPAREAGFRHLGLAEVRRLIPIMPGLMRRMLRSGRYYRADLPTGRTPADSGLLAEMEAIARRHGAVDVAYLESVQPDEIFAGLALPAPGAILFTVEMEPEPIAKAPSFDTFHEVARGYRRLAEIAEAICDFLQAHGHAAYPGTALGGQTDYVALARRAGMGGIGYHGLLLTPQAGARVRIATVYTNLSSLPERGEDEHDWVQDFCSRCRMCVRSCPPAAIHPAPRPRTDGVGTACISHVLCRDYFARTLGCAKCIAVCPFSTAGYGTVRAGLAHVVPGRPAPVDDRVFQVAVVGAGAAGFYATQALLERTSQARVDLIERLPMPHGLVRYGVAPDHPEVRSKTEGFDQTLRHPRVRFLGNVTFGRDLSRAELLEAYDAVVYATGAADSRSLGIPGESLRGSVSATELVGWYNGHPDFAALSPPLGHPVAVLVGAGNVALDVARMLASPVERLEHTDMARHALDALTQSRVREIHLLARGGAQRAAFTPRELHDLIRLPGVSVVAHGLQGATMPEGLPEDEQRRIVRNLDLLQLLPEDADPSARVVVHLRFGVRVVEAHNSGSGSVGFVEVAETTGTIWNLDCGLLIRAIGFQSARLPDVPFDPVRHVIPSRQGRVVDAEGDICPGEYTTGWVRRGPRGIIGTNKVDAEEVVSHLLGDLSTEPEKSSSDALALLHEREVRVVSAEDWERLHREERLRGSREGRAAIRRTDVVELLASLEEAAPLGGPA